MSWLSACSRRRQLGVGLQLGQRQAAVGRAAELLADAARLLGAALARVLEPRLDAGARLALVGYGRLRGAQLLGSLPVRGIGSGQRIRRRAALLLGRRQLAHELLALLLDHGRDLGELGDLGLGLGNALLQGRDLLVGTGRARAPALLLEADRRLALRARPMLALQRDQLGAALATLERRAAVSFCAAASSASSPAVPASDCKFCLGLGELHVRLGQRLLGVGAWRR